MRTLTLTVIGAAIAVAGCGASASNSVDHKALVKGVSDQIESREWGDKWSTTGDARPPENRDSLSSRDGVAAGMVEVEAKRDLVKITHESERHNYPSRTIFYESVDQGETVWLKAKVRYSETDEDGIAIDQMGMDDRDLIVDDDSERIASLRDSGDYDHFKEETEQAWSQYMDKIQEYTQTGENPWD